MLHPKMCVMGSLLALSCSTAGAADANFCNDYARDGVHQATLFHNSPACLSMDPNNPDPGLWSTNFDVHYNWCLRVSVAEADAGRDRRAAFLQRCLS